MCGLAGVRNKLLEFRQKPRTEPKIDMANPPGPGTLIKRHSTGREMVPDLGGQIKQNFVQSAYPTFDRRHPDTTFMPEGKLEQLFTTDAVKKALGTHYSKRTYDFIRRKACKVFATLVFIDKAKAIKDFEEFGVCDNYLPIVLEPDAKRPHIFYLVSKRDVNSSECEDALAQLLDATCKNEWSMTIWAIETFCDSQWKFMAPVFSETSQRCRFSPRRVLPFYLPPGVDPVSKASTFSTVYQAWVHPSNHNFKDPVFPEKKLGGPVAVKMLSVNVSVVDNYNVTTAYDNEIESLKIFQNVSNAHLIKALCTFQHGDNGYYIMFPWATANLREYWEDNHPGDSDSGAPAAANVKWMLEQLAGLSGAIRSLHFLKDSHYLSPKVAENKETNCRHGDLKPDNILLMGPGKGRLVIADVGLTKVHGEPTRFRKDATRSIAGTERYEPPDILHGGARSRAYDIWSFGCICLEAIVWILYGKSGLHTLHRQILGQHKFWFSPDAERTLEALQSETSSDTSRMEPGELDNLKRRALASCTINQNIRVLLEEMRRTDPRCFSDSPIKALLELVDSRLLMIRINRVDNPLKRQECRADAKEMFGAIEAIHVRAVKDKKYLDNCLKSYPMPQITPKPQAPPRHGASLGDDLVHHAVHDRVSAPQGVRNAPTDDIVTREGVPPNFTVLSPELTTTHQRGVVSHASSCSYVPVLTYSEDTFTNLINQPLDDVWTFSGDGIFARDLFRKTKPWLVFPSIPRKPNLRNGCAGLDIWEGGFSIKTTVAKLQTEQENCDLCLMLFECVKRNGKINETHVEFFRIGSTFSFSRYQEPVLSIIGHPDFAAPAAVSLQLGFPQLPSMMSVIQTALLREWIRVCDTSHRCWSEDKRILPTRLLDVNCPGHGDDSTIQLVKSSSLKCNPKYVALSHRWGTIGPSMQATSDKITYLERGFKTTSLPQTFQDAVYVTKELGLRYLWIDCLCIIQDSDQDWLYESVKMEDVFANAYCTIAATRSRSSEDGFLSQQRVERLCKAVRPLKGPPYYICDRIDDFREDVENSELNQRGWVLQERALSRRTIYFAKRQIYWECGKGVYCETLTKLQNRKSALLGDAHFPQYIEDLAKDDKINYFISLYEQYSTRSFTYPDDRQVAILGIERRLLKSLGTRGKYGVFEEYLHRTLLWQRNKSQASMRLLSERLLRKVPSWSWMAYDGGISYMKVPYGQVIWNSQEMPSPFKDMRVDSDGLLIHELELVVVGQELDIGYESLDMTQVVLDCGRDNDGSGWLVVVLGEEKYVPGRIKVSRKIYVILVSPLKGDSTGVLYRRIGAGTLPGREVIKDGSRKIIRVR
ncbi:hypothetical protein KVR01_008767 [Diaporthe batatas]|uniref:uncharacterized protein n=1 Tax=Diaporthe batatas TaxID=748121 RepID=UPI001D0578CC|nr:uncharacterized protein KVR01_008767 [Diaporthe batatas]KAG8161780.1 hypothetical protein KVR01_008767 [Diaporthe batatas]